MHSEVRFLMSSDSDVQSVRPMWLKISSTISGCWSNMPNNAPWIREPSWFSNDNLDMTGPRSFRPPNGWTTVLFLRLSSNTQGPRTTELANHLDCLGALAKYFELCFAGVVASLDCTAEVVLFRHSSR